VWTVDDLPATVLPDAIEAVHDRHEKVAQYQIKAFGLELPQTVHSVHCLVGVKAYPGQGIGQNFADDEGIVNDQCPAELVEWPGSLQKGPRYRCHNGAEELLRIGVDEMRR